MQIVAHEMRTPLLIISQNLSMLTVLIEHKDDESDRSHISEDTEAEDLRRCILEENLTAEDILSNIEL